jgi:hypothetical protein
MQYSPLAIKRRYILGTLADKCDPVNQIPVYLDENPDEPIGFADESLGRYVDAFLFHLPEDVCARLAKNGYDLDVNYAVYQQTERKRGGERLKLNRIILTSRAPSSPLPRRHSK